MVIAKDVYIVVFILCLLLILHYSGDTGGDDRSPRQKIKKSDKIINMEKVDRQKYDMQIH